jgi:hypothetical protein
VPDGVLTLLVDDALVNKSGRKVEGAGFFRRSGRSSPRDLIGNSRRSHSRSLGPLW